MRGSSLLAALVGLVTTTVVHASHVVVPDHHVTIAAAIATGADTVFVRDGVYPESLFVDRPVHLISVPTSNSYAPRLALPSIRALTGHVGSLQGFRVEGTLSLSGFVTVEGCWLVKSLTGTYRGQIWKNVIFGDVIATSGSIIDFAMNTVIGGTLAYNPPGDSYLHDNVVVGPASVGIRAYSDVYAVRNYVRGCGTGIVTGVEFSGAWDNVVEDCAGDGIQSVPGASSTVISTNRIRRCAGAGIRLSVQPFSRATTDGNSIDSVGSTGIHLRTGILQASGNVIRAAGGSGLDAQGESLTLGDNLVLGSRLDGIVTATISGPASVRGNVVGRSVARGIVHTGGTGAWRSNTVYLCDGDGFDIVGAPGDTVERNIAYANAVGIRWSGSAPVIGCDDWFANRQAAVVGTTAGASDVFLDPRFCNFPTDDVSLTAGSPLVSLAGCGQVGALGQGCVLAVGAPGSHSTLSGFRAAPLPARNGVRLSWDPVNGDAELEIFDVTGACRWRERLTAGRRESRWDGVDLSGRRLPPGIYMARLRTEFEKQTIRVVLVR